MARIGISNLQISTDGVNYVPLCSTKDVSLEVVEEDNQYYDFIKDINKPVELSITLHRKKHGNLIQKCLYYQKSKKKRIRKKWNFARKVLEIK